MNWGGLRIVVAALAVASTTDSAWGSQPIGCIIEPERVADVGSPVIGVIQAVLVERGDRVRKGQTVAVLRNDVERAAVSLAQSRARMDADEKAAVANYNFARQRLARSQDLFRKEFISKQALDQAIAEAEVAEQRLAQAREQQLALGKELSLAQARLEERTIRSPFDGIVAERYLSAGERVEEKPLLRVAKVDPLRVEVILPSTAFGMIPLGTTARIVPEMPNATPIAAKVTLVDKVLDAPSNTFRVRLKLPNPGAAIPAGLRCRADFAEIAKLDKALPAIAGAERKL
ncbi:MAG TPA: efflux RND transporter periplasmic adaptor subunit [Burkholderiales bacterium]|nr:efflux RND transporter periplasmic adaptor subunit [Burkholderiales bacterium]